MLSHFIRKISSSPSFYTCHKRTVHEAAQVGFTLESTNSYEKGRPTYSQDSLQFLMQTFWQNQSNPTNKTNLSMVEIGAGTGKFTESFIPFFQKTEVKNNNNNKQLSFTSIEPSDGFRKILQEKSLPYVKVMNGVSDHLPFIPSHSVDAILIAQAYHWMDNTPTLKEFHRILKTPTNKNSHDGKTLTDGGILFLIWNSYDLSYDWLNIVDQEILTPAYGDVPRQQTQKWRNSFLTTETMSLFSPVYGWYQPYSFPGDRNMILNRILSTSVIFSLPQSEKDRIISKLNHLIDHHPEFEQSRKTGKFEVPYITHVAWAYAL